MPRPPGRHSADRAAARIFGALAALVAVAGLLASRPGAGAGQSGRPARTALATVRPPSVTAARPRPTAAPVRDVEIGSPSAPLPMAGAGLVADPADARRLVAAVNDYNASQGMSVYLSADGGASWRAATLPRIPQQRIGDPQLAYGPRGVLYLAGTCYDADPARTGQTIDLSMCLFRSDDGGRHWTWLGHPSGPPPRPPLGDDFPALAVDRTSGQITLAWTRLATGHARIAVATSSDGGRRFGPRRYLPTALGEGAAAVEDAGGAVVAYLDLQHGAIAAAILRGAAARTARAAPLREIASPLAGLAFRVESYPHLARDPRSGRLYLVWASWEHAHAQILLISSTDGGAHWSGPAAVAASQAHDQFMPAVAVSPAGVVAVFYHQRAGPSEMQYHAYLATSVACGRRFAPPVRLDTAGSPLGSRRPSYLGDYSALAVAGATAHAAWTDTRHGTPAIFTRAVAIPATAATC